MTDVGKVISEFRHIFTDLPALERELASRPGAVAMRSIVGEAETQAEAGGPEDLDVLQAEARKGIRKLREGIEDELTPTEVRGLEAIIHLDGRPAIFVQDGNFFPAPERWQALERQRVGIKSALARVGRIEIHGHPEFDWIGTGFLVGPQVVMTNEHVAREFAYGSGEKWYFRSGCSARLDLREELGSVQPLEIAVDGILGVHPELDLALLRVADRDSDGKPLPPPLTLVAAAPEPLAGRMVYVIGYPAWDGRRNDPEAMRRIFAGIFNVKRLAPGTIRGADLPARELVHDCSTLGGNSGSPVIDLDTHQVVGLHFSGRYLEGNRAIPLWLLQDDPLLRQAGAVWA